MCLRCLAHRRPPRLQQWETSSPVPTAHVVRLENLGLQECPLPLDEEIQSEQQTCWHIQVFIPHGLESLDNVRLILRHEAKLHCSLEYLQLEHVKSGHFQLKASNMMEAVPWFFNNRLNQNSLYAAKGPSPRKAPGIASKTLTCRDASHEGQCSGLPHQRDGFFIGEEQRLHGRAILHQLITLQL